MTRRRRSDQAIRAKLRSPGRPPVGRRLERERFWAAIAAGHSSEDAAAIGRVSPVVGVRWFREAGGMPPSHLAPSARPPSGRYLSFTEREEIALLRVKGHGVREIGRRLARSASTISRELRRMRPHAVAALNIVQRRHNGMRIAPPGGQSRPSW